MGGEPDRAHSYTAIQSVCLHNHVCVACFSSESVTYLRMRTRVVYTVSWLAIHTEQQDRTPNDKDSTRDIKDTV